MKLKNMFLVGAVAAGAFWLLSRQGNAQDIAARSTGTGYGATITTTKGETIQLREENGLIVDQYGGIWT